MLSCSVGRQDQQQQQYHQWAVTCVASTPAPPVIKHHWKNSKLYNIRLSTNKAIFFYNIGKFQIVLAFLIKLIWFSIQYSYQYWMRISKILLLCFSKMQLCQYQQMNEDIKFNNRQNFRPHLGTSHIPNRLSFLTLFKRPLTPPPPFLNLYCVFF